MLNKANHGWTSSLVLLFHSRIGGGCLQPSPTPLRAQLGAQVAPCASFHVAVDVHQSW